MHAPYYCGTCLHLLWIDLHPHASRNDRVIVVTRITASNSLAVVCSLSFAQHNNAYVVSLLDLANKRSHSYATCRLL